MIFKIVGVGVVGIIASLIIKQYKPEISLLITIATGVVILFMAIDYFSEIINTFLHITVSTNVSSDIINTLLKVVGIGYLVEFSADIAEDSGNSSIAHKIVFGGKIIIAGISLPLLIDLFETILGLL